MLSTRPDGSSDRPFLDGLGQASMADQNCKRQVALESPKDSGAGGACLMTRFCSKPCLGPDQHQVRVQAREHVGKDDHVGRVKQALRSDWTEPIWATLPETESA